MIRRVLLTSVVLATLGAGVVPALAGPSDPTTVPLYDRYVCVSGSENPQDGVCVWVPLPV